MRRDVALALTLVILAGALLILATGSVYVALVVLPGGGECEPWFE